MRVLLTGDSHLHALEAGRALLEGGKDARGIDVVIHPMGSGEWVRDPFFIDRGTYAELVHPGRRIDQLPPAKEKFDLIGFSSPMHTARVWRMDWHEYDIWSNAKYGAPNLISNDVFRKIIFDDVAQLLSLLEVVNRTVEVFVVEAPWPFLHHKAVKLNGRRRVSYINRFYRNYVRERLIENNIPLVEVERSWISPSGFMHSRFKSALEGDPHHANSEFGRLMMKRVFDFLASRSARAVA